MHWRPGFSDVTPRMRVAFFPDRLVVTTFQDASEWNTFSTTEFEGDPSSPWREIVKAILDSGETVTMNEEWPAGDTLARASELAFDRAPSPAMKVLALTWLGSQWSQVAQVLICQEDAVIEKCDKALGLLRVAEEACASVEEACLDEDFDGSPLDFLEEAIVDRLVALRPGRSGRCG